MSDFNRTASHHDLMPDARQGSSRPQSPSSSTSQLPHPNATATTLKPGRSLQRQSSADATNWPAPAHQAASKRRLSNDGRSRKLCRSESGNRLEDTDNQFESHHDATVHFSDAKPTSAATNQKHGKLKRSSSTNGSTHASGASTISNDEGGENENGGGNGHGHGNGKTEKRKKKPRLSRTLKQQRKKQKQEEEDTINALNGDPKMKDIMQQKMNKIKEVHKWITTSKHTQAVCVHAGLEATNRTALQSVCVRTTTGDLEDYNPSTFANIRVVQTDSSSKSRSSSAGNDALKTHSKIDGNSNRRNSAPPIQSAPSIHISVKPLLILDLNGILCHRRRQCKEAEDQRMNFRRCIGVTATTPVIPRTDLVQFLEFLDQHFCLALWTSAMPNTKIALRKMLIPDEISHRFLFAWSQEKCEKVKKAGTELDGAKSVDEGAPVAATAKAKLSRRAQFKLEQQAADAEAAGVVHQKILSKVWKEFPLWNVNNTLLMDDSPEKCTYAKSNCLHPPAINGHRKDPALVNMSVGNPKRNDKQQQRYQRPSQRATQAINKKQSGPKKSSRRSLWISDSMNEAKQNHFFQLLANYWDTPKFLHTSLEVATQQQQQQKKKRSKGTSTRARDEPIRTDLIDHGLYKFLRQHGVNHMGYRSAEGASSSSSPPDAADRGNVDTSASAKPDAGAGTDEVEFSLGWW